MTWNSKQNIEWKNGTRNEYTKDMDITLVEQIVVSSTKTILKRMQLHLFERTQLWGSLISLTLPPFFALINGKTKGKLLIQNIKHLSHVKLAILFVAFAACKSIFLFFYLKGMMNDASNSEKDLVILRLLQYPPWPKKLWKASWQLINTLYIHVRFIYSSTSLKLKNFKTPVFRR